VVSVAIIGATVMPHNFFLHTGLIAQSNKECSDAENRRRGRFYARETGWTMGVATLINAAILIFAVRLHGAGESFADVFNFLGYRTGREEAFFFGAALAISGLASSTTATLASDYVLAAFLPYRIRRTARRAAAAVPAAAALICMLNPMDLMLWSQAILALILPAVVIPFLILMASNTRTGATITRGWSVISVGATTICIVFDLAMIALIASDVLF